MELINLKKLNEVFLQVDTEPGLKQDIPRYLESDSDLIKMLLKIDYQKEKVETVKSIISSINGRSYHISNAIKWQQFLNGIN